MTGRLECIVGPMFSGKSEELMRRLRRHQIAGRSTILLRPNIDTRYDEDHLISHSGLKMPARFIKPTGDSILDHARGFDVIGIDEIQFFDNLDPGALISRKQIYIVTGLDTTFRGEPFGQVPELMALSDKLDKLNAICAVCGSDAVMTQRLEDGVPAKYGGPTVLVGGLESYEARCRECFSI